MPNTQEDKLLRQQMATQVASSIQPYLDKTHAISDVEIQAKINKDTSVKSTLPLFLKVLNKHGAIPPHLAIYKLRLLRSIKQLSLSQEDIDIDGIFKEMLWQFAKSSSPVIQALDVIMACTKFINNKAFPIKQERQQLITNILYYASGSVFNLFTSQHGIPYASLDKSISLSLPPNILKKIQGSTSSNLPQFVPYIPNDDPYLKHMSRKGLVPAHKMTPQAKTIITTISTPLWRVESKFLSLPFEVKKVDDNGEVIPEYQQKAQAQSVETIRSVMRSYTNLGKLVSFPHVTDTRLRTYSPAKGHQVITQALRHPEPLIVKLNDNTSKLLKLVRTT